jgi:Polysaccharide pyruvyl transferase
MSAGQNLRGNVFRNNVGNLVFSHAAHRVLSTSRTTVTSNRFAVDATEAARINEEGDVFVVPLANAFRPSFRDALNRLTRLIEQLKVPVVVLGVGAQTGLDYNSARLSPMSKDVKRFVGAVLDRSPTIGVRGAFTHDYLAALGFRDVEVIGCPAMFMYGDRLPATKPVDLDQSSKISIGISPYLNAIGPFITRQLASHRNLTYLPQDIATLKAMLRGESAEDRQSHSDVPRYLSHPLFTEDKTLFFLDPEPWIDYLRGRDLYVGTRIHGTVTGVLAGIPSVLIAHDSRTRELAEHHQIPYTSIDKVSGETDAIELYADADFSAMHRVHADRFRTYREFLDRHGLDNAFRPGESTQPFDDKVASASFPGPVRAPRRRKRYAQLVAQGVLVRSILNKTRRRT